MRRLIPRTRQRLAPADSFIAPGRQASSNASSNNPDDAFRQGSLRRSAEITPPTKMAAVRRSRDVEPENTDTDTHLPGDGFGLFQTRTPFYRPVRRLGHFVGELDRWMPEGQHPELCVNPDAIYYFKGRYGVTLEKAYECLVANDCDTNRAAQQLQEEGCIAPRPLHGPFGVVALESYYPEAFCLAHILMPSFEATRDPQVLEVVHELVMSAAEMPMDIPRKELLSKFTQDWTIDDGTPVREVLAEHNLTVADILIVPYGEYAAQGFFVAHPMHPDFPNIGTAAACCCLDFRAGIHSRFRFHVERIADSTSEHIGRELIHFGSPAHVLRQPFWWEPSSSIEDYLRQKETLLAPSALIFEMRTAVMAHGWGFQAYRNIVEMEKLKTMQFKYDAQMQDHPKPSQGFTSDGARIPITVSTAHSPSMGLSMNANPGVHGDGEQMLEDRAGIERDLLQIQGYTSQHWRRWRHFYENHTY